MGTAEAATSGVTPGDSNVSITHIIGIDMLNYVSLVIDFFGKHVSFFDSDQEGCVLCRLKVSESAMKHWAVEHASFVRVVSPEGLVEKIRDEIGKANANYGL